MTGGFHDRSPADARGYLLSEYGYGFQLGEHFNLGELASRDGAGFVIVHPDLVWLLEALRAEFGVIHVNSGYRTPMHNARIGGKLCSYHTLWAWRRISFPGGQSPPMLAGLPKVWAPAGSAFMHHLPTWMWANHSGGGDMFKKVWSAAKWLYNNIEEIKEIIELLKNSPKAKIAVARLAHEIRKEQEGSQA